jgi:hypothetical protein
MDPGQHLVHAPSRAQAALHSLFRGFRCSMDPFCNNVCAVVVGLGSKRLPADVNAFMRVRALECLRTRMNESLR